MTRPRKRPTSTDVARAAGVSQTTVSFVLNNRPGHSIPEETRQRVLDAARQLDYRLNASARSLAAGRSDIVLLAVPDVPLGAGLSHFIEGLADALAAHRLTLVTHLAGPRGRALPDVCASVGASVVVGSEPFDAETVEALHRAGADVVLPAAAEGVSSMAPIGHMQAQHLIDRGHRRLGYAMPAHHALRRMGEERLRGARDACTAAGLPEPVVATIGLATASASEAVAGWRAESVTAVCAFNDETAIAVLAGMRAHDLRAPGDIAVIGVDDIPTAPLSDPPLTTVHFDVDAVVRRRAEWVVAELRGGEPVPVTEGFAPELVLRSST
ncbi:LacI family DNA-binding transcriptional regulator [Yinghuangia aomiensis]|uniref:LacI family DNA-binding transcriptional regulator n=1 Tax=Yinghuangia aomiensis TaxID=676205 RepID=A0ABP9I0Q5_9ACTN